MEETKAILIYGDMVKVRPVDKDTMGVIITGFDVSQIIAEFNVEEVLDALLANDQGQEILDFVADKQLGAED